MLELRRMKLLALSTLMCSSLSLPALATDDNGPASTKPDGAEIKSGATSETPSGDAGVPIVRADIEKSNIEKLLATIEKEWNEHNLDSVMGYYADDYMNNDGLDKKAVSALTQDFWKTYPDAKSSSVTKQIRVEGSFATVESRDMATGTTAKEMPGIGSKGELQSVSEGQLYLKKQGAAWKIIGDRIDYEKVKVAFGLARQLQAVFAAPEQVKASRPYTARLELNLEPGLSAVGSISSTPLQYPQPQPNDVWRPMNEPTIDHPLLERVMTANLKNRNELLMATIGLTDSSKSSLKGIAFLTRRLNVVPHMDEEKSVDTTSTATSTTEKKVPELPK